MMKKEKRKELKELLNAIPPSMYEEIIKIKEYCKPEKKNLPKAGDKYHWFTISYLDTNEIEYKTFETTAQTEEQAKENFKAYAEMEMINWTELETYQHKIVSDDIAGF